MIAMFLPNKLFHFPISFVPICIDPLQFDVEGSSLPLFCYCIIVIGSFVVVIKTIKIPVLSLKKVVDDLVTLKQATS